MAESVHPLSGALSEGRGGLYLNVHAQPGARRPQLRGLHGDALKIAVSQQAQEGKANEAILRFVADGLHLGSGDVELVSGQSSRRKRLFLHGDADELGRRLKDWLDA